MNTELFDEAIGAVPPSTVDVDAAIVRGRRAARIGRLGSPVVAVSAGVFLMTGGLAAALLSPAGDGLPVGGGSAGLSTCADTPPSVPKTNFKPPPLTDQPADTARRLTGVLRSLVEARLPAGSQLENPSGYPLVFTSEPLEVAHQSSSGRMDKPPGACWPQLGEFVAAADVTRNGKAGAIRMMLGRHGGFTSDRPKCTPEPEQIYCAVRIGPKGERIVMRTVKSNKVVHRVDIAKPDGTWVIVDDSNDASWFKVVDARPPAAEPPFTLQQLLEIGLDGGMSVDP